MANIRGATLKPLVAALAAAACLAGSVVRAAPLVSQFCPQNDPLSYRPPGLPADLVSPRAPAGFGPYADAHPGEAAEAGGSLAGVRPVPRPLGLLGRLRLTAFVLFLFPQYSLALASEAPPPPPPSLHERQALTAGGGTRLPHEEWTWNFPNLELPPRTPPVSEAPEPTTLFSGALGAVLAVSFACRRRS
jgi:hypothetical protein